MPHDIGFVDNSGGTLAHYKMLETIRDFAADNGWQVLRYDASVDNRELILKGLGYTGEEEIFVGFRTYQNADADYYNLCAAGFTGYVPSNPFGNQPGTILSGIPSHNQHVDYWLTLNPQRIMLAMKVGLPVYESGYVGKMLPYGRPSQYPYPLVCGGMLNGAAPTRFSDSAHSGFFRGNTAALKLRSPAGWVQPQVYPWSNPWIAGTGVNASQLQLRDTGGVYHPLPLELHDGNANLWGALDGIFYITGFDNTVESTFVLDGINYVCIQDVWRTDHRSFYAMRLDV